MNSVPRRPGVAICLGIAALVASGATRGAAGTALYCGTKPAGTLASDGTVRTPAGEAIGHVHRKGTLVFGGNDPTLFDNGYAKVRIGGLWYVSRFFQGNQSITTRIGTVRRRTARRWDAYIGFGGNARRVGYALGAAPSLGAVGLLLVNGLPCKVSA